MSALAMATLLTLAAQCAPGHAPSTLIAVAQTESGRDPLGFNDNTTRAAGTFPDVATAVRESAALIAQGHSVDLGLMQINSRNLGWLGLTVAQAFDACESLRAGARVLLQGYAGGDTEAERQASLRRALSAYNTGNARAGFANGYVRRIEYNAAKVIPAIRLEGVLTPEAPSPPPGVVILPPPPPAVVEDGLHPGISVPAVSAGLEDALHPPQAPRP